MTMNLLLRITSFIDFQSVSEGNIRLTYLFHLWIVIMLSTAFVCFVIGEITRNYSQTDKVWSIMPIVYSLITLNAFPSSPRIWLMTILVLIWGIRLSYNFYRKGGYDLLPWKGEEDYRWAKLRQHPKLQKGIRFTLFNLFFISIYQHVLILLFSLPLLLAAKNTETNLSVLDYAAASFMLLFILIETIADNQLHIFQFHKRNKITPDGKYSSSLKRVFLTEGLWNYVRHPNYIAEQATWVSFYFFGVAASGIFINTTLIGPFLLILLFMGSSEFTERISLDKYPDYKNYKKHVPKFIPLLFRSRREHKQKL
jgi:steroid 5-alpha reductase family enzyme